VTQPWYERYAELKGLAVTDYTEQRDGILEGLEENKRLTGIRYCPCIPAYARRKDEACPCKPLRDSLEHGGCDCRCLLFVPKET
jgi:ferredoxin-thioredoxin reductase catalytic subunit